MEIGDKEYELIQHFGNATLEEILNEVSGVTGPSKEDLEILEYISKVGLPKGVLNVLIFFTKMICNNGLSKNLMERIAIEWSRRNVKTPMEAVKISKLNGEKYREWAKIAEEVEKEVKQSLQLIKEESTRLKALELAASSSSMSDKDLGKFVREMFKS
ncbi:DnaD domain protein [Niallia sp. JL1B1071]|uniref:DnaD domain protein n=1 Tax=Niallia tiangongensis TaxID=3237105 RepID=UPI0037DC8579